LLVAFSLGIADAQQIAKPQQARAWKDLSPHRVRFVSVEPDVKLEVLDWGGSGRPIVLLTGYGNSAHVFDGFAPKLTRAILAAASAIPRW